MTSTPIPTTFRSLTWVLWGAALLLLGLATLWLPPDGDQALFYISGRKIVDGAVVYRDFIDLKPPLIYYLNAVAIILFGDSFLSVRILETLFQFGAIGLIVVVMRRATRDDRLAIAAGVIHAAIYFGMNFNDRAQVEGFAALPIAALIYLLCVKRGRAAYLVAGLCLGILGLLKTTLLILLLPSLLVLFISVEQSRRRWWNGANLLAGTAVPFGIMFLLLGLAGALDDYANVQRFVSGYAAQQLGSPMALLNGLVRIVPTYLARIWSLLAVLLIAFGIVSILVRTVPRLPERLTREHFDSPRARLILFVLTALMVLALSIVVEGKFLSWHFVRLLVPAAILGAFGMDALFPRRFEWRRHTILFTLMGLILIGSAILFSPLPRILWSGTASIVHARRGIEGFAAFYGDGGDGGGNAYSHTAIGAVGRMMKEKLEPGETFYVASGWGVCSTSMPGPCRSSKSTTPVS